MGSQNIPWCSPQIKRSVPGRMSSGSQYPTFPDGSSRNFTCPLVHEAGDKCPKGLYHKKVALIREQVHFSYYRLSGGIAAILSYARHGGGSCSGYNVRPTIRCALNWLSEQIGGYISLSPVPAELVLNATTHRYCHSNALKNWQTGARTFISDSGLQSAET